MPLNFDPPPLCSMCKHQHEGVCPLAPDFNVLAAIVGRDMEIAALRAMLEVSETERTIWDLRAHPSKHPYPLPPLHPIPPLEPELGSEPSPLNARIRLEQRIVALMQDEEVRTSREIADALGVDARTVRAPCAFLSKNNGPLVRIGTSKEFTNAALYQLRTLAP